MDDTLESLRHQRNLLAAALGNVLGAYGVIRRDAPMTAPELLLAAETAIEGKRHGKPRQPEVRPWHPPDTIPDNGSEFEYLVAGSDRVHLGACYNDFGGTVRAEPNTTAWRWPAGSVEAIFEAEKETRLAVLLSQLQQAGGYLPRRRLSKGTYAYTISDAVREGYIELDGAVGLRITSGGLSKIVDLTYPEMEPEPEVTAPRCP